MNRTRTPLERSGRDWALLALRWIPALACAAAIFWLSHQSSPPGAQLLPSFSGHLLAYFGLASCLVWGYSDLLRRWPGREAFVRAWAWSVLYGVSDELHQWFVPLRHPDVADLLWNALGAMVAVVAGWAVLRRLHGPRQA